MLDKRLYLRTPQIDDLDYRRKLLADEDTMSYNIGYGENGTGCYFKTKEDVEKWYKGWFSVSDRYYAYIYKKDSNEPIGDVAIRYDEQYSIYMISIVIEAKYRGRGYAEEALRLLADKAFYELGLEQIADNFPVERIAADTIFRKVGFSRVSEDLVVLTKSDYEKFRK